MRARLIFSFLWLVTVLGAGNVAAETLATQSSHAAGVTIKATPRALPGGWAFEIVFDTHTQELSDDLLRSATLLVDGKRVPPTGWQGDPPGGHHRKGTLKFNQTASQQILELAITRPGESKPRLFRWQLK